MKQLYIPASMASLVMYACSLHKAYQGNKLYTSAHAYAYCKWDSILSVQVITRYASHEFQELISDYNIIA